MSCHEFVKRWREQKRSGWMGQRVGRCEGVGRDENERVYLVSETVEGSSLSLERVHDVEGGDRLPLRVLGVGDRVSDHV